MNDVPSNFEFLAAQMADPRTNWSLGTFGAIAEFARDADEPLTLSRSDVALAATTGRGGIRIEPGNGVRLFASASSTPDSWNRRIACGCRSAGDRLLNDDMKRLAAPSAALVGGQKRPRLLSNSALNGRDHVPARSTAAVVVFETTTG